MSNLKKCRKSILNESSDDSKYKRVTHVIFDCDGTLLDTESIRREALNKCLKRRHKHMPKDSLFKILGRTDLDTMKLVIAETGIDELPTLLLKEFLLECKLLLPFCSKMEGAERIVKYFRSKCMPMAVATSSSLETMKIKTRCHTELFRLFDFILLAGSDSNIKKGKPAPDIYFKIAKTFNHSLPPQRCLVFEDSPSGVAAAISAGMQVVMIPPPNLDPSLTSNATLVLSSLSEFNPNQFGLPECNI